MVENKHFSPDFGPKSPEIVGKSEYVPLTTDHLPQMYDILSFCIDNAIQTHPNVTDFNKEEELSLLYNRYADSLQYDTRDKFWAIYRPGANGERLHIGAIGIALPGSESHKHMDWLLDTMKRFNTKERSWSPQAHTITTLGHAVQFLNLYNSNRQEAMNHSVTLIGQYADTRALPPEQKGGLLQDNLQFAMKKAKEYLDVDMIAGLGWSRDENFWGAIRAFNRVSAIAKFAAIDVPNVPAQPTSLYFFDPFQRIIVPSSHRK